MKGRRWNNWTGGAKTFFVDVLLPLAAMLAVVALFSALAIIGAYL